MEKTKRESLIKGLIANTKTAWQDKDTDLLQTLTDEQLTRLEEEANAREETHAATQAGEQEVNDDTAEQQATAAAQAATAPAQDTQAAAAVTLEAMQQAVTSAVAAAMQQAIPTLHTQMNEYQERQQLVTQLAMYGWTEAETRGMGLESLRKLATQMAPTNFSGMGLPAFATQAQDDGPSDDPNWD